jgi:hypothetical protein
MKHIWLGYLVYSLGNYIMKLCIETGPGHSFDPLGYWTAGIPMELLRIVLIIN